jgi:hypothetical protein
MPVIPAMWEAENKRIMVQADLGKREVRSCLQKWSKQTVVECLPALQAQSPNMAKKKQKEKKSLPRGASILVGFGR